MSQGRVELGGQSSHERGIEDVVVTALDRSLLERTCSQELPGFHAIRVAVGGRAAMPENDRRAHRRRLKPLDERDVGVEQRKVALEQHRRDSGREEPALPQPPDDGGTAGAGRLCVHA